MGHFVLLAAALFFLSLDMKLMDRRDSALFRRVFGAGMPRVLFIYGFLVAGGFFLKGQLAGFLWLVFLAIYLIRRRRFDQALQPPTDNEGLTTALARDALTTLVLWFLTVLTSAGFLKFAGIQGWLQLSALAETVIISGFSNVVMLVLILRTCRRYQSCDEPRKFLGVTRNGQPLSRLLGLPVLAGLALAFAAWLIMTMRPDQPNTPMTRLMDSTDSVPVMLLFILVAVVMAPFFEEIIFRGFFFYVLNKFKGLAGTIVIISGVFAWMHVDQYWGDYAAIAMIALVGLVLTSLRAWTGSVIPGIVTHYVFNTMMVLLPIVTMLWTMPVSYREYQMRYPVLDPAQREVLLRKAMLESPEFAPSYNDLAWIYAEKGEELDEALRLADRALALVPGEISFVDTKAEVLFKMGRADEAVALEEGLLIRRPKDDYILRQLKRFRSVVQNSNSSSDEGP